MFRNPRTNEVFKEFAHRFDQFGFEAVLKMFTFEIQVPFSRGSKL